MTHIQGNTIGHGAINDGNKIGLENLLPNFTRNLMNRNNKDGMINDIGGLKHRQSESAKNNIGSNVAGKGNLNTISNDKYGNKAYNKQKANQDSSAGKAAFNKLKVNGKDDPKKKD